MWSYYQNELYHYGIKGMKWGRRRNRINMDAATNHTVKTGKDKSPISPLEKMTKESGNIVNNASNAVNAAGRIHASKQKPVNLDHMSDADLKNAINRMNLEASYKQLSQKDVNKGFQYASDMLSVAGGIIGITASSIAIATSIKSLRG